MALALKTTGQALDLKACLVVDDDGTTVVDLVSGNTISVNENVTVGTDTWKSVSRKYFETSGTGTTPYGVTWTGTKPSLSTTSPAGIGLFVATAGLGTAAGTASHIFHYGSTTNGLFRPSGSSKLTWGTIGGTIISTADVPQDWTKLSIGAEYVRSTSAKIYLGLESGSLALDNSTTPGNFGGGDAQSVGGISGQGYQPARIFVLAVFSPPRTLAQMQALHDDWFGELIDAGSTPVAFTGTVPTQSATEGTPFSADLSSYFSGSETPFTYSVQSGTLPAGLTLNSSTGVISGTPTTAGTASGIVIRATDAGTDTADSNSFSIDVAAADTTAPVLTSPTGTATGQTTASGTVSTDEASGTLYYLATTNSTESAATVKGGSSQAVTATGGQSVSVTGLTAATGYYLHYVHRDAAGNDSTVASSSLFTTDAVPAVVPGVRIQLHDGATEQASLTGLTVAWFDDPDPATMGAPVLQSSTEATDASGWLEVDLDGYTALDVGDPGFLIVYKAGATAVDDIVFAGRRAVQDIA